ncbi:cellulase family glycosylhydrolase [Mycolicibacterium sp.]|uniref:cellulase family glycosylhydrolase n=1 Tax=Mycolicibacterium sp. TaxID=2320850 RepID=UPI001A1D8EF9|nr:cellulase family glycosylhydrolase [Mycolicibacterium sp.]MBJ7339062.1 cellulase family glycosylhydrolase [Mycolicibacterium sp.]
MTGWTGRFLARAAACLVVGGCTVMPPADAAPPALPAAGYGFGDGAQLAWLSPADVNRELDAVAKTSATWLRVLIPWSDIEVAKGQYDWGRLDTVVDAAVAHDLKVLGVIAFSPGWARAPGADFTAPPNNASDYADFAAAVVRRYQARVSDWQLWNEPNLPMFFGRSSDNSRRYTELIKAAYPAIKSVQPSSTVVLAGLSRLPGDESPPAFLTKVYAAGGRGSFDAAAAHPYVFPTGFAADPEDGWSNVGALHDVMSANGDGDKKIWMTEFGAPTCDCADGVSPWGQAEQIFEVLRAAAALDYSGPAFIYSIRDTDTANRGDREANFGALLTSDWRPKWTGQVLAY